MNEIKTHDTMSPEAQRISIAEECGWLLDHINRHAMYYVPSMDCHVGDPLNDLNTCHEFEKSLPNSLTQKYWWSLCDVTGLDQYEACRDPLLTVSATAAQRCEAFLRTIGKWGGEA